MVYYCKKHVICYMNCTYARILETMNKFMIDLSEIHGICISRVDASRLCFETPHVIVRYVSRPGQLVGCVCDEIFNAPLDIERMVRRCSMEPYSGTLLEYILEIESRYAYERTYLGRWCDMSGEIDIVEFVETVVGIQLLDLQKELLVKMYENRNCKIVMGRLGKMYLIPEKTVEE